ncbi:AAA family ATPase [Streptosporangiaceae bacterium NEAU-GS5]|nr:AAA family ATPase [Streptosporangiaceae bacterium NEAU-GS5]
MLDDMIGRAASPVFVGRVTELATLAEAYDQARKQSAGAVLVGGEAGVGKTRLVSRFAEKAAEDGAHVLLGGCIELSTEGLAYAPFTAALRQLVRECGAAEVTALLPDGAERDLARLLPEFGEPSGDVETDTARARLFEQILTLLERLAEKRPVLLLIEDIHWADRSSRDLISFLCRNVGASPILMVMTYRADELHRTHPLRPVLAELSRVAGVTRLDLPRFSREEVAEQVAGILGTVPTFAQVSKIFERSEGIALFVEALVDCGEECGFPDTLHDLIIGSVEMLPEETQRVLRIAAAGGVRVGHDLLAAVSALSDVDLEDALRPAIAANVLQVADGGTYAFRHALIREAVHDELLPGEHTRMHARYAQAIDRDRSLVPHGRAAIELAHHWHSARDDVWALISAWDAAAKAAKMFAHTEQLDLLERVLTLWEKVPDAAERIGTDHTKVLEKAADAAYLSGELDKCNRFVRAALEQLDEAAEPERVAELLVQRSDVKISKSKPGALDDLRHAMSLVPEPSETRAYVLSRLSRQLILAGHISEGAALTNEAIEMARALGDECSEADLLMDLALGNSLSADLEGTIAINSQALAIGTRLGSARIMLRAIANNIDALNNQGRSAQAVELALEGEKLARKYGRVRGNGLFIANNRAEALESTGRWDEALEIVRVSLALGPNVRTAKHLLRIRADITMARGEFDISHATLGEIGAFSTHEEEWAQEWSTNARLVLGWYLLTGKPERALEAAERALANPPWSAKAMLGWRLLALVRAVCDAAADRDRVAAIHSRASEFAAQMRIDGPVSDAFRLAWEGEFDTAAERWAELGRPYAQARTLTSAARIAAEAGDRDGAAERLRIARPLAVDLHAVPLVNDIDDLARRVGADRQATAADSVLTSRELEVLRLVAEGRSNREIAAELFISAKTASVHVSNILAKLGVATRGEAAAQSRHHLA